MKCESGVLHSAFGVKISFSDLVMCVSLACLHTVGAFPLSVSLPHLTGLLIIVKPLPSLQTVQLNVLCILFAQMDFLVECQNLNL